MLNPSDVYVSGGSNDLLVCWTDKVTKYDASSFYNWEQDNLPLHDLDERTHLLWEKLGHPTSALTGMSFIVSADATDSCNPLYFTTLSACIAALPEVINCPILVEVASFGNLGGLNLSNKAFGPNGSLEIINRNSGFGGSYSFGAACLNLVQYDSAYTSYDLASSVSVDPANTGCVIALLQSSAAPTIASDLQNARMFTRDESGNEIFISSGTSPSAYADSRFTNPYVFVKKNDPISNVLNRMTAALSSTEIPWDTAAASVQDASAISFAPFDKTRTTEMDTYDVSTVNSLTDGEIEWGSGSDNECISVFAYFNSLDYIKVNNCNGPVYIRNFNVDSQHARDRGIEIKNSQVNLERCSVSRANKAGLYADNSEVNLLRGFVAYRNYKLVGSVRTGVPFAEKRDSYQVQDSYGAGIYAVNSTVNLKSTYDRDVEKAQEASAAPYYAAWSVSAGSSGIPIPSLGAIYCLSRNDIGIHAVDSHITGGRTELDGQAAVRYYDAYRLTSELNTEAGVKLENSTFDNSGKLFLDGNYFGLDSENSTVNVDTLAARYNQSTALKFSNSEFVYNKDLYAGFLHSTPANVTIYKEAQVACIENGQDVLCDNSIIRPVYTSSMPSIYNMFYTSGCFGREDNSQKLLPSVQALGNSDIEVVHAHFDKSFAGVTDTAQYGLMARVEDNSTLTLMGSVNYANVAVGPDGRTDNLNVAGFYGGNGSTIKIQGPTSFINMGVNILAEDGSNVEFTPHQSSNGSLLVSSFDLSNASNHTMVELHSTRACVVANRNSNILMENLGYYQGNWENGAYGSALTLPQDYVNSEYETYVSGGFIQFYPNANINSTSIVDSVSKPTGNQAYRFDTDHYAHDRTNHVSGISTGGMCVRALENSLVQANNVHFPATWPNASSPIYDIEGPAPLEGPNCSRLFIWNIADDSLLKASYLSVSGHHPKDSGYHGPSGTWGVSAAPSSTPDTSSLSILDYYGQGTENPFGKDTIDNFGAFRLYFSTDPVANFMVASGSNNLDGWARQLFAQGYHFSGNFIASGNADVDASGNHLSVLLRDANGDINASGFYYASSMLATPDNVKAVLDDSALNTFANAKHNTVGKSGLAKVVQGYYGVIGFGGDSYNDYDYGKGIASINNFDLKKDN